MRLNLHNNILNHKYKNYLTLKMFERDYSVLETCIKEINKKIKKQPKKFNLDIKIKSNQYPSVGFVIDEYLFNKENFKNIHYKLLEFNQDGKFDEYKQSYVEKIKEKINPQKTIAQNIINIFNSKEISQEDKNATYIILNKDVKEKDIEYLQEFNKKYDFLVDNEELYLNPLINLNARNINAILGNINNYTNYAYKYIDNKFNENVDEFLNEFEYESFNFQEQSYFYMNNKNDFNLPIYDYYFYILITTIKSLYQVYINNLFFKNAINGKENPKEKNIVINIRYEKGEINLKSDDDDFNDFYEDSYYPNALINPLVFNILSRINNSFSEEYETLNKMFYSQNNEEESLRLINKYENKIENNTLRNNYYEIVAYIAYKYKSIMEFENEELIHSILDISDVNINMEEIDDLDDINESFEFQINRIKEKYFKLILLYNSNYLINDIYNVFIMNSISEKIAIRIDNELVNVKHMFNEKKELDFIKLLNLLNNPELLMILYQSIDEALDNLNNLMDNIDNEKNNVEIKKDYHKILQEFNPTVKN